MGNYLAGYGVERKLRLNHRVEGKCWRWLGAHTPKGYGQLSVNGKKSSVHRLAYELAKGPIPHGLEIDHLCFVRDCINPAHLEMVTHAENVRRQIERRTHCPHGHEYTPANTRWQVKPKGYLSRQCRRCDNEGRRAKRRHKKAQVDG